MTISKTKPSKLKMYLIPLTYLLIIIIIQLSSRRPTNLGPKNQQLAACPSSPNCVSSFAIESDLQHFIPPIAFENTQDIQQKIAALNELTGFKLIEQRDNYFYFECTSLIMRFTDDLEFLITPEQKIIHVRSASRIGHSDLGANRSRVEKIRRLLSSAN